MTSDYPVLLSLVTRHELTAIYLGRIKYQMKTQSEDTHPDAERVQIELLRRASVEQRVRLACNMSETVMQLAWRAIQRANPDATEDEVALKFVAVHYGKDLESRLRKYLSRRQL